MLLALAQAAVADTATPADVPPKAKRPLDDASDDGDDAKRARVAPEAPIPEAQGAQVTLTA